MIEKTICRGALAAALLSGMLTFASGARADVVRNFEFSGVFENNLTQTGTFSLVFDDPNTVSLGNYDFITGLGEFDNATSYYEISHIELTPDPYDVTYIYTGFRFASLAAPDRFLDLYFETNISTFETASSIAVVSTFPTGPNDYTNASGISCPSFTCDAHNPGGYPQYFSTGAATLVTDATNPPSTGVPEPITLSMFGVGVVGAAAMRRRRKGSRAMVAA